MSRSKRAAACSKHNQNRNCYQLPCSKTQMPHTMVQHTQTRCCTAAARPAQRCKPPLRLLLLPLPVSTITAQQPSRSHQHNLFNLDQTKLLRYTQQCKPASRAVNSKLHSYKPHCKHLPNNRRFLDITHPQPARHTTKSSCCITPMGVAGFSAALHPVVTGHAPPVCIARWLDHRLVC